MKIPPVEGSRTMAPRGTPRTFDHVVRPIRAIDVAWRPSPASDRITTGRRVIILRLIRRDRRAEESSGSSSGGGTDPCAPTRAGRDGTDERAGSCAANGAETCPLTLGRFAGTQTQREKARSRDRRDKIFFHDALDSKVEVKTDVPAGYSGKLQQLAQGVQEL